jgi:hypothetical protein
VESQSQTRNERRAKLLVNARQAESFPASMTDKDWIDVICWVLPESNADGLLKDLRKKDVIMAKLLSLERDWRSYIPRSDIV